jgi:ring-1,2-phenylacetyl-CoA epoxidase subunit PaaC
MRVRTPDTALFEYLLRLGDTDLVFAQRLGEWIGHGPVLEEDIALANVGLDLLGQARLWLGYAGEVEARFAGKGRSEDELAFLRDGGAFRNLQLAEQPNGDYAFTMARQFYFDHAHALLLRGLAASRDERVAAVAAKASKEVRYHVERSSDWIVRLGDGTEESHARMQRALDALWPYTGEMFAGDAVDAELAAAGLVPDPATLRDAWRAAIGAIARGSDARRCRRRSTCTARAGAAASRACTPSTSATCSREMQFLQRAYPGRNGDEDRSSVVPRAALARPARVAAARPSRPLAGARHGRRPGSAGRVDRGARHRARRRVAGRSARRAADPTYSGCPATEVIERQVRDALARRRHRRSPHRVPPRAHLDRPTGWRPRRASGCATSASRRREPARASTSPASVPLRRARMPGAVPALRLGPTPRCSPSSARPRARRNTAARRASSRSIISSRTSAPFA